VVGVVVGVIAGVVHEAEPVVWEVEKIDSAKAEKTWRLGPLGCLTVGYFEHGPQLTLEYMILQIFCLEF
jgi:hypothetical protein